jgi:16S rRNA (guanine527-N7)-methyltransferase
MVTRHVEKAWRDERFVSVSQIKQWVDRTRAAIKTLGLSVRDNVPERLVTYMFDLIKWNRTYNLTALKTVDDIFVQHINDCLAIVASVSDHLAGVKPSTDQPKRVLDVGSGAGLPGVVIALCLPQVQVMCIDAVAKKVAFIRHVAATLKCANLQGIHARIESLEPLQADMVVSRAFASLTDFSLLAGKHANDTGVLVSMKSKKLTSDIQAFEVQKTGWCVTKVEPLTVLDLNADRYLVWLERKS